MKILLLVLISLLSSCQFLASPAGVAIEEEIAEEALEFVEFELSKPEAPKN